MIKRYKCRFCSEDVHSLKKYQKHIRRIHNNESEINKNLATKDYLKRFPDEMKIMISKKGEIKTINKIENLNQNSKSIHIIYTPMGNKR